MAYVLEYDILAVAPSGLVGHFPGVTSNDEAFAIAEDIATMRPDYVVTVLSRLVGDWQPAYMRDDVTVSRHPNLRSQQPVVEKDGVS